jgi:hypothetical protein
MSRLNYLFRSSASRTKVASGHSRLLAFFYFVFQKPKLIEEIMMFRDRAGDADKAGF